MRWLVGTITFVVAISVLVFLYIYGYPKQFDHQGKGRAPERHLAESQIKSTNDDDWTNADQRDQMTDKLIVSTIKSYPVADGLNGFVKAQLTCEDDGVKLQLAYMQDKNHDCADVSLYRHIDPVGSQFQESAGLTPFTTPVKTRIENEGVKATEMNQKYCNSVTLNLKSTHLKHKYSDHRLAFLDALYHVVLDRTPDTEEQVFQSKLYRIELQSAHGKNIVIAIRPQSSAIKKFYDECRLSRPTTTEFQASQDEPEPNVTPIPKGWHTVSLNDFKGTNDYHYRLSSSNGGLQVSGDFDGDGKNDVGRVLQSDDGRHCAFFLTNFRNGVFVHYNAMQFDTACTEGQAASIFAAIEPAVTSVQTWCGKTNECGGGEQRSLKLLRPGINIGVYEGGYSTFYWDDERHTWNSANISE